MIRFFVPDRLHAHPHGCFDYRIAGHDLRADVPLFLLSDYACGTARRPLSREPLPPIGRDAPAVTATGWLAGQDRRVICRVGEAAYRLEVENLGWFLVARSDAACFCAEVRPGVAPGVWEETLLGPPLTFALALRGVWCLHASAVLMDGKAILLLGSSGQGKSTLAAYLDGAAEGGWRRLADDIVPCVLVDGVACARPHFPQLKLAPADRYPASAAQDIPIGAFVVLQPTRQTPAISVEPLRAVAAARVLAEQTVAVGLFDSLLHASHLKFLATLVGSAPVYRMSYPHDYGCLSAVSRALDVVLE